jgi:FkbM family methyltransferase
MRALEKKKRKKGLSQAILIMLGGLVFMLGISIYTATNVHIVINLDSSEGDDIFSNYLVPVHTGDDMGNGDNTVNNNDTGDDDHALKSDSDSDSDSPKNILSSILKRRSGDGWEIKPWGEPDEKAELRWANFTSTTGVTRQMAIHPHFDFISRAINKKHRWIDCDMLPKLWNERKGRKGKKNVYVDIGANIGSCVMEMLLSTDAPILVFEPHPKNQLCLRETIARLEPEMQERVMLVPVALGEKEGSSTIYSAFNNMGNSVVGQVVKDYDSQKFEENKQHEIRVERLDSIIQPESMGVDVKLLKLDAQGYECRILEGMGNPSAVSLARSIQEVKFEWAQKWIDAQNCKDLLPKLRDFGFEIYRGSNLVTADRLDEKLIDLLAKRPH